MSRIPGKLKSDITFRHIEIVCRQFEELVRSGVSENRAIRLLEFFVETYCKRHSGARRNRLKPKHVTLWSHAALKHKKANPELKTRDFLRVEHGTPRRSLAREVLKLYRKKTLTEKKIQNLAKKYWRVAVISIEEDKRLNAIGARSKMFESPEARWEAADITFPKPKKRA